MARHPNQTSGYRAPFTKPAQQPKPATDDAAQRARDAEALKKVQETRPMVPYHRRKK